MPQQLNITSNLSVFTLFTLYCCALYHHFNSSILPIWTKKAVTAASSQQKLFPNESLTLSSLQKYTEKTFTQATAQTHFSHLTNLSYVHQQSLTADVSTARQRIIYCIKDRKVKWKWNRSFPKLDHRKMIKRYCILTFSFCLLLLLKAEVPTQLY